MPRVIHPPPSPKTAETSKIRAAVIPPDSSPAAIGAMGFILPAVIPPHRAESKETTAEAGRIQAVGSGLLYRISEAAVASRTAVRAVTPSTAG
jgi:hypothetical protein